MKEKFEYNVECVEEQNVEKNGLDNNNSKKNRKKISKSAVALVLCCLILGGAIGAGGVVLGTHIGSSEENKVEIEMTAETVASDDETVVEQVIYADSVVTSELTPAEIYSKNVNSTVGITTSITTNYWGFQTTSAASGSGFIISENGYLLTNYHVIEDANEIKVTLYDGTVYEAELIGYDESNDVAVLKIDGENFIPVTLGDSDTLLVGDYVVAIGNPLGELTFSLTHGIVSALDREVTMSNGTTMNLIQTDAAINSGNSGGALFNMKGEVIGITNAKYSSDGSSSEASIDNIGFAIPINRIKNIVSSIIEKGYIEKPYIGVTVSDVSTQTQSYGYPAGAAVNSVNEGSPAEEAGLMENDIITAVNGTEITGSNDLVTIVGESEIGDSLTLSVYRDGLSLTLTVIVGASESSALGNDDSSQENQQYFTMPRMFGQF